jgi:hypothetical protein
LVDSNKDDKLDNEIAQRLDDLFGEGDAPPNKSSALKADDAPLSENKSPNQQPAAADDEIFDLEDLDANETDTQRTPDDHPLVELKNMVLSIDWEITDEVLVGFLSQIDELKNTYKNEKIILMFLQLLGSLGEYIKTNRGNAHPKTFKILNSAFSRLEEVVQKEDMAASEKKKLLKAEMNKYKQLRKQVAQRKTTEVGRKQAKPVPKDKPHLRAPDREKSTKQPDKVSTAVEELKQFIHTAVEEQDLFSDSAAAKSYDSIAEAVEELKKFIHTELSALKQELKILKKSK